MMSLKKLSFLSAIALALTMTLTACGSSDDNAKDEEKADQAAQTQENNEATSEETAERELLAGAPLQDGTYTLTEKDFDDHGWKAEMSIVVEDGKIKESTFDYVNADGVKKSEDEAYQEKMAEKTGVGPADFVPQLNAALVEVQNPLDVDVVTGATSSSQQFLNYAQQLVQAAAGDTTPIEIDTKAPLQDGEYKLTEKNIGATG